jgi:hypothetical protein
MIVDRYDPMNLFEELVPKLNLKMEPELRELDRLLEDDVLFERVRADLCQRYPNYSARLGRHSTPVEVILRMLVVRRLYAASATSKRSTSLMTAHSFAPILSPLPGARSGRHHPDPLGQPGGSPETVDLTPGI